VAFQRTKPAAIGVKAPYPGFIEPELATSVEKVPSGERWLHEIKFDGYRVQLHIANDDIKVFTRRGNDWTKRFKKIASDACLINAGSAVIDDLLYLNGYDLRKLPLTERKAHLKKLVAKTAVQFSESFEVDGREMYQHACSIGLEGVVSKVRDSRYHSGRSNDWTKKTCTQRETLPIAGFALDGKKWDGCYLGRRKGKDLVYAGKVDHGFDKASAKDLQARLKPLIRKTQPYAKKIAHRGIWVKPSLRAEIEYRAKSAEGKVRHPFFKGLREDL
jgi:bifunctional non-homologous end joining protein LigD